MYDIQEIRKDFPILGREVYGRPLVYLDNGATTQKPRCVVEAMTDEYYNVNANVHRGVHFLSQQATELHEAARETVRRFLNARSPAEIVFTRGTTESINLVASCFGEAFMREGDEVILSEMEHHSNIVPWQLLARRKGAEIRVLPFDDAGALRTELLPELVDERTRVVAVTQASNTLGTRSDLRSVIEAAHAVGAVVVVDGCQGVVHGGVNVREMDCDFYAFSGHKLYGPTGIGVLYGKRALLEEMPPFLTGGEMIDSVTEQDAVWAPVPEKFEAGTQDAASIYATGVALDYLANTVGYEAVQSREQALVTYLLQQLAELDYVDVIGPDDPALHHGVVSFNVRGIHPHDVASIMDMSGVCIRAGHHCAQPLLTWLGVENLACCRASVAFYNDKADIDKFIAGLHHVWSTFNG